MRNKLTGKCLLAYVAGIMDGEGSVTISKAHSKKTRIGYQFVMYVTVRNTNEWLIHWLYFNFGGNVGMSNDNGHKRFGSKPIWYWQATSRVAMKFLKSILPYLQMKREQAEVAIQFQERKAYRGTTGNKRLRSNDEWAWQEAQHILIQSRNKGKVEE